MTEKEISTGHARNVAKEISEHGKTWCSKNCQTFLPSEYEKMRSRYSKAVVQRDYDLCHMWR